MKIAYLYFAYKNPNLMKRTMSRLTGADCSFFVHIDGKIDIDRFAALRGETVFFTRQRITVHWAEFSGVEAILLLLREALSAPGRFDYFVLMSGSEYPLRSRDYIWKFFQENRGWEFITMSKISAPGDPLLRMNTVRYPSTRPMLRFASRVLAKVGLARRDYRKRLGYLEPYSGITWWALSREACEYIVKFNESDRVLNRFLESTFAPEEIYIHTVLGNSPFKYKIRRNLLYEDWSSREHVRSFRARWHSLPAMISEEHCKFFEDTGPVCVQDLHGSGELLFARKFSDENLALVDRMDEMIKVKEANLTWRA
jgi:hypothetical protein